MQKTVLSAMRAAMLAVALAMGLVPALAFADDSGSGENQAGSSPLAIGTMSDEGSDGDAGEGARANPLTGRTECPAMAFFVKRNGCKCRVHVLH